MADGRPTHNPAFADERAISLLRRATVSLARNVCDGVVDFPHLDATMRWEMFVGDIAIFSRSNHPTFHYVSTQAARSWGLPDAQAVCDLGGLRIMSRYFKAVEGYYWVGRLLRLPAAERFEPMDYVAHMKVRTPGGKLRYEERRWVAIKLPRYRGRYDIMVTSFRPDNLDREAFTFAVATSPDPRIRARAQGMYELCGGKRRLQVFELRAQRMGVKRIAERLGISHHVVGEHLTRIYECLGLRENKLEGLMEFAAAAGIKREITHIGRGSTGAA